MRAASKLTSTRELVKVLAVLLLKALVMMAQPKFLQNLKPNPLPLLWILASPRITESAPANILLKKEIAVGHGQFLSMLDDYTLCTDQALPALHEQLRQNFDSLVDQSPETMSKKIMSIISSDSKLRATCDTI